METEDRTTRVYTVHCPARRTLELLGAKWTPLDLAADAVTGDEHDDAATGPTGLTGPSLQGFGAFGVARARQMGAVELASVPI